MLRQILTFRIAVMPNVIHRPGEIDERIHMIDHHRGFHLRIVTIVSGVISDRHHAHRLRNIFLGRRAIGMHHLGRTPRRMAIGVIQIINTRLHVPCNSIEYRTTRIGINAVIHVIEAIRVARNRTIHRGTHGAGIKIHRSIGAQFQNRIALVSICGENTICFHHIDIDRILDTHMCIVHVTCMYFGYTQDLNVKKEK